MIQEARELLLTSKFGVLSTHSVEVSGYPFGSWVAYCLDKDHLPIIQISALAQHTKNISKSSKASLTVVRVNDAEPQNSLRVVYLADVEKISSDDKGAREMYYRTFPSARSYGETLDFSLFRLKPVKIQFIGGFGKIGWIEAKDWLTHA